MAGNNKQTKTEVQKRDLPAADPLPAAYHDDRPAGPLAIRPVERGSLGPEPIYPRRQGEDRDGYGDSDLQRQVEGEPGAGPSPIAAPLSSGWEDGSRGWDGRCVQQAREQLGHALPDLVSARLRPVLGGGPRSVPELPADPPLRAMPGRRSSPLLLGAGRPAGRSSPPEEPDDA